MTTITISKDEYEKLKVDAERLAFIIKNGVRLGGFKSSSGEMFYRCENINSILNKSWHNTQLEAIDEARKHHENTNTDS